MRILPFIFLSLCILAGCKPDVPSTPKFNTLGGSDPDPDAPRYWRDGKLPLNVYVSEEFENDFVGFYDSETEKNPIEQIQQTWDASVSGKQFFNLDLAYVDNYQPSSMDGFDDNEIGIYKSHTWYSDVSSGALAVTQFYALRRNIGTSNEYLDMQHADIVLNYSNYSFTMDENNNQDFDLLTVVSHELGHLLGLGHIDFNEAVMNSFLSKSEVKRELFSLDENAIQNLYEQGSSSSSFSSNLLPSFSTAGGPHPDEGERVQGMIELMADGTCRHYENGHLTHQHTLR